MSKGGFRKGLKGRSVTAQDAALGKENETIQRPEGPILWEISDVERLISEIIKNKGRRKARDQVKVRFRKADFGSGPEGPPCDSPGCSPG